LLGMHAAPTMTHRPLCLWLEDEACLSAETAGDKAGLLGELTRACPIPPAFCLTRWAYRLQQADGGPGGAMSSRLASSLDSGYNALRHKLNLASPRLVVRSSPHGAGGRAAVLNVRSKEALIEAVLQCWASAPADRAGGVIVQSMVHADVSALILGQPPGPGSGDELLVKANWGLGNSLARGFVGPDTYAVRRRDGVVRLCARGDKELLTILEGAGITEITTPRLLQLRETLAPARIREAAALALAVERRVPGPVEIECAWDKERLYLISCRPVVRGHRTSHPAVSCPI
jgi:phosphoenolpyruvate synthase/pyruvate phosphate dikinase